MYQRSFLTLRPCYTYSLYDIVYSGIGLLQMCCKELCISWAISSWRCLKGLTWCCWSACTDDIVRRDDSGCEDHRCIDIGEILLLKSVIRPTCLGYIRSPAIIIQTKETASQHVFMSRLLHFVESREFWGALLELYAGDGDWSSKPVWECEKMFVEKGRKEICM